MHTQTHRSDRDVLVHEHLDMARRVAGKVARRARGLIDPGEAESAAMLGLVEAADRYDGRRGVPFVAFAAPRIRGAVLDELRRGDPALRRCRRNARKLAEAVRRVETRTGAADPGEVALALGMTEAELAEAQRAADVPSLVPFDDGRDQSGSANDPVDRVQRETALREALEHLPQRDLLVLWMYYRDGLNQKEIGQILGVTESRVCQILNQCRRVLRAQLGE